MRNGKGRGGWSSAGALLLAAALIAAVAAPPEPVARAVLPADEDAVPAARPSGDSWPYSLLLRHAVRDGWVANARRHREGWRKADGDGGVGDLERSGDRLSPPAEVVPAISLPGDHDIPDIALAAYRRAAERSSEVAPGCDVRWTVLAGIGRVESNHGRAWGPGTAVSPDGDVSPSILGPQLNGTTGTAAIPDTDGGRLDGDTVWDRAVGPMQFIPSSWRRFARDGTGNGQADPNNFFDAALAAVAHLCLATPGDYDDRGDLTRALLGYNRSASYAATVLAWIDAYDGVGGAGVRVAAAGAAHRIGEAGAGREVDETAWNGDGYGTRAPAAASGRQVAVRDRPRAPVTAGDRLVAPAGGGADRPGDDEGERDARRPAAPPTDPPPGGAPARDPQTDAGEPEEPPASEDPRGPETADDPGRGDDLGRGDGDEGPDDQPASGGSDGGDDPAGDDHHPGDGDDADEPGGDADDPTPPQPEPEEGEDPADPAEDEGGLPACDIDAPDAWVDELVAVLNRGDADEISDRLDGQLAWRSGDPDEADLVEGSRKDGEARDVEALLAELERRREAGQRFEPGETPDGPTVPETAGAVLVVLAAADGEDADEDASDLPRGDGADDAGRAILVVDCETGLVTGWWMDRWEPDGA